MVYKIALSLLAYAAIHHFGWRLACLISRWELQKLRGNYALLCALHKTGGA